nr:pyruvate, phosphate dikinase regulatory protein, chloroplastic [Tanacetum cinerariifolium]
TYKQLFDSIKSSRVQSKEHYDDLINKVNLKSVEVSDLNASLQEKVLVITALKEQLSKLKGKAVLTKVVSLNPIDPALLQVDVATLVPKLRKNRDTVSSSESAPTFAELFETNELKAQIQEKDTVILKLKEKIKSSSGDVKERKVERKVKEVETLNLELDHKVTKLAAENEHLKQTYKQLFDSIKSSRVQSKEQSLKEQLKGKAVLTKAVSLNPINPALLQVDVVPLVPKLRKNKTAHIDYIKHTQEEAATLRELVKSERLLSLLNTSLAYACKYTRRIQELLMILQQTYLRITDLGTNLVAVTSKNQTKQIRRTGQITKSEKTSVPTSPSSNIDSNTHVLSST